MHQLGVTTMQWWQVVSTTILLSQEYTEIPLYLPHILYIILTNFQLNARTLIQFITCVLGVQFVCVAQSAYINEKIHIFCLYYSYQMCLFPHEQRISVGFEPTIFLIAFLSCIVLITITVHYLEHAIYSGYSSMHFPAVIQGLRLLMQHSKVLKWIGLYLKIISSNVNILTGLHERRGVTSIRSDVLSGTLFG